MWLPIPSTGKTTEEYKYLSYEITTLREPIKPTLRSKSQQLLSTTPTAHKLVMSQLDLVLVLSRVQPFFFMLESFRPFGENGEVCG